MYFREQDAPHFHALCSEHNAVFDVQTPAATGLSATVRVYKMVHEWASQYQAELLRMQKPVFAPLANGWLFRTVQVDPGGYRVSWNEEIDLAESKLWGRGLALEVAQTVAMPV